MASRIDRVARKLSQGISSWTPSNDPTSSRDLILRLLLVGALAMLTLVLFPPPKAYQVPAVRVGVVAGEDVIAPFDYPILRTDEELSSMREATGRAVPPVFSFATTSGDSAVARIEAYLDRAAEVVGDSINQPGPGILNRYRGRNLGLRARELRDLSRPVVRARLREFARATIPDLYVEHLFVDSDDLTQVQGTLTVIYPDQTEEVVVRSSVIGLEPGAEIPELADRARDLDPEVERLALHLLPGLMPPSLEPRPALTAVRREQARRSVNPVKGTVLRGELIVSARTRVTQAEAEKVRSLATEIERQRGGFSAGEARIALGRLSFNVLLLLLFGFYLYSYQKDVFGSYRALAVVAVIWGLVTGLAAFVDGIDAVPSYAVPVALGSLLIAILWDTRLSAGTTMYLAVYLSAQGDLGFALLWSGILSGLAGAWSVRRIRRRTHFYESLLLITFGTAVAVQVLGLMGQWTWGEIGVGVGWGALSAALAVFLSMGLLPVLEWASGRTTDLTLLELADLNRPLLKQLLLKAPGTYHHSIVVGNLAETAVEEMGANSLLARVGAYYHDIGKVERPEYFAENQRDGFNPHSNLKPEASARIVSRHVSDGVAMARAAGLPRRVIDFIREHHGTTRLSYFWHKAEEESGEERSISDFAYPGPKPRSKETAVVMLADSVEAASRLVRDPSPDRFRGVVQRIIEMKLDERQLDNADLTFRDLALVEETFVSVLAGIHHERIEYPAVSLHAPEVRDEPPDSVSSIG